MGMDRSQPTKFSSSKLAGDQALQRSKFDWVVLRPSVVLGPGAYGGSALVRGLAALHFTPDLPTAKIQPVHIDDVTRTVAILLEPTAPSQVVLELAGPDVVSLNLVVSTFRTWLGNNPAKQITLPAWFMEVIYRLGDLAGWLGWRPPIRSTAKREMQRGAVGDTKIWREVTERRAKICIIDSTDLTLMRRLTLGAAKGLRRRRLRLNVQTKSVEALSSDGLSLPRQRWRKRRSS